MKIDISDLFFGEPIYIQDIGTVYPPITQDILKIKEEKYKDFLLPYMVTLESFFDEKTLSEMHGVKLFDIMFLKNPESDDYFLKLRKGENDEDAINYLELLRESLEFFFKDEILIEEEHQVILIGKQGLLHRENFDNLCQVILAINKKEKIKYEKPPEFKSERQKDVYIKLMQGRQRNQKENEISFIDMCNIIIHGGKNFIPYNEVKKMTIYQLYNTYNAIVTKDSFETTLKSALAGSEESCKEISKQHWTQQLKVKL